MGDGDQCRAVFLDCFEEQIEDRRLVGGVEVTLPPDEFADDHMRKCATQDCAGPGSHPHGGREADHALTSDLDRSL